MEKEDVVCAICDKKYEEIKLDGVFYTCPDCKDITCKMCATADDYRCECQPQILQACVIEEGS